MTDEVMTELQDSGATQSDRFDWDAWRDRKHRWVKEALEKHGLEVIVSHEHVGSIFGEFEDGLFYMIYPENIDPMPHGLKQEERATPRIEVLAEAISHALSDSGRLGVPADSLERLVELLDRGGQTVS